MILSDEQLEALARQIIDGWDMDTLIQFAVDDLYEFYRNNPEGAITEMDNLEIHVDELVL